MLLTTGLFLPSLCSRRFLSAPYTPWSTHISRKTDCSQNINLAIARCTPPPPALQMLRTRSYIIWTKVNLPESVVFLDLSKAFHTIDHDLMLNKLISLGFSDTAVIWFKAYLTNRSQSVYVNGVVSDPQSIPFGIPQGSILGPLLFIIYINDLPSVVTNCDIQLYADDTLLFYNSSSIEDIESCLSADLSNVISWLDSNFLFLNYTKTKVMLLGTHQRLAKVNDFCVSANSVTIGRVYQFKYLDSCLIQRSHGTITSITFLQKYHLAWVCCGKPARSFLVTPVLPYIMP